MNINQSTFTTSETSKEIIFLENNNQICNNNFSLLNSGYNGVTISKKSKYIFWYQNIQNITFKDDFAKIETFNVQYTTIINTQSESEVYLFAARVSGEVHSSMFQQINGSLFNWGINGSLSHCYFDHFEFALMKGACQPTDIVTQITTDPFTYEIQPVLLKEYVAECVSINKYSGKMLAFNSAASCVDISFSSFEGLSVSSEDISAVYLEAPMDLTMNFVVFYNCTILSDGALISCANKDMRQMIKMNITSCCAHCIYSRGAIFISHSHCLDGNIERISVFKCNLIPSEFQHHVIFLRDQNAELKRANFSNNGPSEQLSIIQFYKCSIFELHIVGNNGRSALSYSFTISMRNTIFEKNNFSYHFEQFSALLLESVYCYEKAIFVPLSDTLSIPDFINCRFDKTLVLYSNNSLFEVPFHDVLNNCPRPYIPTETCYGEKDPYHFSELIILGIVTGCCIAILTIAVLVLYVMKWRSDSYRYVTRISIQTNVINDFG